MRLYEYEGKELFKEWNISVPKSEVASTEKEALQAARKIGFPVVVKAQVKKGGRGKEGLIKMADSEEDVMLATKEIISRIGSEQKMLIEEKVASIDEGYVGITVDDVKGVPILVISSKGGMDIEKVAELHPEIIAQIMIDPQRELYYHQILNAVKKAGYKGHLVGKIADLAYKTYKVFVDNKADTVEINPVLLTHENMVLAGDAKVVLDEYAVDLKPSLQKYREKRAEAEGDTKAIFVPLDGDIGIVSFGASNTMMLIDSIKYLGGNPANFSDIAGGVDHDTVKELTNLIFRQCKDKAKVVLINVTLAGASLKVVIEGIIEAIKTTKPKMKLVANVRATSAARAEMDVDEAALLLQKAGVLWCDTWEQAIDTVITMSKE